MTLRHALALALVGASLVLWGTAARCGEEKEKEKEHEAAHGGCLNAIGTCDNGHAEVKLEGAKLRLWFVGGGNDTKISVKVPDETITLAVRPQGAKEAQTLVIQAKPIKLAEEKVGDCSYFEGRAKWLDGLKEFAATGAVTFKGKKADIRIDYPAGYDPDEKPEKGEKKESK